MIKIWDNATLVALIKGCLKRGEYAVCMPRVSLVLTLSQNSTMGWNINNVYMLNIWLHLLNHTSNNTLEQVKIT